MDHKCSGLSFHLLCYALNYSLAISTLFDNRKLMPSVGVVELKI